ncbi:TetR/AcrR family transcriptional regulator [Paenibacillus shunpengii]|uniref:TetR/AcrR family transcriptional regulator n=1 Tax=Paenibacillus shunpengii TaxID=2054424 RepID=A0ABW5STV4_9BACL
MGEIRNAERTRNNIFAAARKEFFEKGYTGARLEAIAAGAGVKKQLLYHYFKGKEDLFEAMLEQIPDKEPEWASMNPTDPVHIAEHRFKVNTQLRMDFLRFTTWEALEKQPEQPNRKKKREAALQSYVDDMKAKKEAGLVPKDLDPVMLTLALISLSNYPLILGDVTRMVTGTESTDPQFQEDWANFLTQLSARIFRE